VREILPKYPLEPKTNLFLTSDLDEKKQLYFPYSFDFDYLIDFCGKTI
jgi:hypothetical protein